MKKAPSVIVIDHHRKTVDYIQKRRDFLSRAARVCPTSEMVTELFAVYGQKADCHITLEANALMAGIMLDTKEFVFFAYGCSHL